MPSPYKPPQKIREWIRDTADGERHELAVLDNRTVCIAVGHFAHSSGSRVSSWEDFLSGSLDEMVRDIMGESVLDEALSLVRDNSCV